MSFCGLYRQAWSKEHIWSDALGQFNYGSVRFFGVDKDEGEGVKDFKMSI
jgi:hypothetical protein